MQAGETTVANVVRESIRRIDRDDLRLGAFLSVWRESALSAAQALDALSASDRRRFPLLGVPVAVKDLFCTRGERTTCGSRLLESFTPHYDATVVERLVGAGAVIVGKTNLDEFGMGSTGEFSAFRATQNPWCQNYSGGGSSSGSAVAVAARMVPCAIGTDTGGSVRQPAAWCGITGMKPTYGAVSRFGMIAFASSLDQAGFFANSARDIELLFHAVAGRDVRDMTSRDAPPESPESDSGRPLRIGYCPTGWRGNIDAEVEHHVQRSIEHLRHLGHQTVAVDLPHERFAIAAYYVIAMAEAASNLARYDGVRMTSRASPSGHEPPTLSEMYAATRFQGFGPEVRRRILLGTFCLSHGFHDQYYQQACRARRAIRDDYARVFEDVDVLIGPTSPTTAVPLGSQRDPVAAYWGDVFTVSANLAGIPALSFPVGFSAAGLPIGAQVVGPWWGENRLLKLAAAFQDTTDFHQRKPAL